MSPREAPELMRRMQRKQPVILAYLLAVDHELLNQDEREMLVYLGTVVWEIMIQGSPPPPRVTEAMLDRADEANVKLLESLVDASDAEAETVLSTLIANYRQPEVLRYVVEALHEAVEAGEIRDEYDGMLMIALKTVIDCLG
jgi:hypothetical protein